MRDYRLQTVIDLIKVGVSKEVGWQKIVSYLWWWLRPTRIRLVLPNKFFDLLDLAKLRGESLRMAKFDPFWFPRLFEITTLGIRTWEYGILLQNLSLSGKKVLDLGAGSSRLPYYLASLGAKVIATDLLIPMEKRIKLNSGVTWKVADMTNIDFPDKSFDVVLNISAIEHLDADYPSNKSVSRELFWKRTELALAEMVRVCKEGGLIYLTTDFYSPQQKSDSWKSPISYRGIGAAYKASDLPKIISILNKLGCQSVGTTEFDFDKLKKNPSQANFRGRYFTTGAFLFRRLTG